MTSELFSDWFINAFIPNIKKHQRSAGNIGKVLLLVDNCVAHTRLDSLNSVDDLFKIIFLPPNVTSLIQPMDQGVIHALKIIYKQLFVDFLVVRELSEQNALIQVIKDYNIRNCLFDLSEAWNLISKRTLKNSWNSILRQEYDLEELNNDDYESA